MKTFQIIDPQNKTKKSEEYSIGIDLGTTNTVVAYFDNNTPIVIPHKDNCKVLPSIVSYLSNETVTVGEKISGSTNIHSIKSLMGRGVSDFNEKNKSKFKIVKNNDNETLYLDILGKNLSPVEISSEILKQVKTNAELFLSERFSHDIEIKKVVITTPAYFDNSAKQATKDAATLAGLEAIRIINEPTAAALAYGFDNAAEGIYAIYDLGGGTFDISILKMQKGVFQVLATGGDISLGGDDIDSEILKYIDEKHDLSLNLNDLPNDEYQSLLLKTRSIKEDFSKQEIVEYSITTSKGKAVGSLNQETFTSIITPIIDRTISIMKKVLIDAKIEQSEVNAVILVGGSTKMQIVKDTLKRTFPFKIVDDINPDEVVAAGAALQAHNLTEGSNILLLDVIPLSLGIETIGGIFEKIIPRNSTIPITKAQEFTTFKDNQTAMTIHVLQGERELTEQNRSLAKFTLRNIPPQGAGLSRIKVIFQVDSDGLLKVSAQELTTKVKAEIEVKPTYGISIEEMTKIVKEGYQFGKEDIKERITIEKKNQATSLIDATRKALKEDIDLISPVEITKIEEAIKSLEISISSSNIEEVELETKNLNDLTENFAEKRMNRSINNALKNKNIDKYSDK